MRRGHDLDARGQAQYGAWLCGACLGATTMSLHHKLCHALGGTLDLPHAPTHTVVLPHALAFNQPAVPQAVAALSRALDGAPRPGAPALGPRRRAGRPRSLRDLGWPRPTSRASSSRSLASPYANPSRSPRTGVTRLLHAAWAGDPPIG